MVFDDLLDVVCWVERFVLNKAKIDEARNVCHNSLTIIKNQTKEFFTSCYVPCFWGKFEDTAYIFGNLIAVSYF